MRSHLPDVNVLIALHDPEHPFHQRAQDWLDNIGRHGWATCPLTENGFMRRLRTNQSTDAERACSNGIRYSE